MNSLDIYTDHPSFRKKKKYTQKEKKNFKQLNVLQNIILKTTRLILIPTLFLTCYKDVGKVTYFVHLVRGNIEVYYHRGSFLCLNSISMLLQNKGVAS